MAPWSPSSLRPRRGLRLCTPLPAPGRRCRRTGGSCGRCTCDNRRRSGLRCGQKTPRPSSAAAAATGSGGGNTRRPRPAWPGQRPRSKDRNPNTEHAPNSPERHPPSSAAPHGARNSRGQPAHRQASVLLRTGGAGRTNRPGFRGASGSPAVSSWNNTHAPDISGREAADRHSRRPRPLARRRHALLRERRPRLRLPQDIEARIMRQLPQNVEARITGELALVIRIQMQAGNAQSDASRILSLFLPRRGLRAHKSKETNHT